jgi:tryptophan synthase alpha chain
MNRIDRIFADLRGAGRKALMPYLTAGDPSVEATARMLPAIERAGAAICEVGIPFSDPIADGPVIQASMTYALDRGTRTTDIFAAVKRVRPQVELGLIAMVSYSIVHKKGPDRFIAEAAAAGFDGFIFPDLPVEEADAVIGRVRDAGLVLSFLISPTTPLERAERIAKACSGFVYVLARAGITGERSEIPRDLPERLNRLRSVTSLPMAVGFGVANAEQVRQVVNVADAAIVGSAIMRRVTQQREQGKPPEAVVESIGTFVGELARGLEAGRAQAVG